VVTLRRASPIYFLRPAESGFLINYAWCLFSLVLGWWGIPWGPIYTLGSLWTNLRGGLDLTDAVLSDMRQGQPSPLGASAEHIVPVPRPSWHTGALAAVGTLVVGILIAVFSVQDYKHNHMPVALMNGLDLPYEVSVNGTARTLRPHQIEKFEIPEGVCTVSARLPGGVGRTEFSVDTDTFTTPGDKVLVLNPDAAALIITETTIYAKDIAPKQEPPAPTVRFALQSAVLPAADFFFEDFPPTINLSKHANQETRTRLFGLAHMSLQQNAGNISHFNGPEAAKSYVKRLGALLPANEDVLELAVRTLSGPELGAIFALHLDTRPVVVNWHRYYQGYAQSVLRESELLAKYRSMAEAAPDEGDLAYLCGRLEDSAAAEQRWYERALAAKSPSVHAHRGMAHVRAGAGDYEGALASIDLAEKGGIPALSLFSMRSECLLALGRKAEALRACRTLPIPKLLDVARVEAEMHLAFLAEGRPGAEKVLQGCLAKLTPEQRKDNAGVVAWLKGNLAYYEGDSAAYLASLPAEGQDWLRAMLAGKPAEAARAASVFTDGQQSYSWLLIYLEAVRTKDPAAASYWEKAVENLEREQGVHRRLAAHLRGREPMPLEQLLKAPLQAYERRVLLTALAVRDPANRAAFLGALAPLSNSRQFPHHILSAVTASLKAGTAGPAAANL
jgi:hypothetical protein